MTNFLDSARLKIVRAEEHRQTLEDRVRVFSKRHAHAVVGHFDPKSSEFIFKIHIVEETPRSWSLLAGDFAQNLRAAMDHIAWQLVSHNDGSPGRHTGFPIFTDPEDYRNKAPGAIHGMSDRAKAFIQANQPFNTSPYDVLNDPLFLVNEIARIDRHRLLHTTVVAFVGASLRPVPIRDIAPDFHVAFTTQSRDTVQGETEIMRVLVKPTGPNPHMTMEGVTGVAVMLDVEGVGPIPITALDVMRAHCKGVWDEALYEFV